MATLASQRPRRVVAPRAASLERDGGAEHVAHKLIAQHSHFFGRANQFRFVQCDDVLTIQGRVPSFYLKQVLQSLLQNVGGVRRIDNQVDVVASNGLSSVRGQ